VLWDALRERSIEEYDAITVIYLEEGDTDWLEGFAAGKGGGLVNDQVYDLVKAIRKLGQVEVVWITE